MRSISVVIGTFGSEDWSRLAARAARSVYAQTFEATGVHICHEATLAEARNAGALEADGEWLCFLDADDELDPDYLRHMTIAIESNGSGGDLLLQPATLGVVDGREDPHPVVIPSKPLLDGNYMVIGTVVRRDTFLAVGGFRDLPIYEDWDLWIRCALAGAQPIVVEKAIYRVTVTPGSRNDGDRDQQVAVYNAIRDAYIHLPNARKI